MKRNGRHPIAIPKANIGMDKATDVSPNICLESWSQFSPYDKAVIV